MKNTLAFSALAAVAATLSAPASAQMKPASAEDVAEAIKTCKDITSPTWIDKDALKGHGWHQVRQRGRGRGGARLYNAYETRGNDAYLVFEREDLKAKNCVVLARLENTGAYNGLAQGLAGEIGMPNGQDGFAYIWDQSDYIVRMEPSGDRDTPNARFTIKAKGPSEVAPEAIITED
ncbi:hypothetical protein [Paraurantiacibacter namhicola]|uniref:Uncharacterized protein n=1 Tax=Paraurantiacibacter namhicola TaxID=645517 RepID=A0A1C7D853_9SPHN|nr:hypothetical protein [Paraurantiacibacter namhicola]ANU07654.1 hypothetical protein A6F65_01348 [Paraurantiacibacter namhicola]